MTEQFPKADSSFHRERTERETLNMNMKSDFRNTLPAMIIAQCTSLLVVIGDVSLRE